MLSLTVSKGLVQSYLTMCFWVFLEACVHHDSMRVRRRSFFMANRKQREHYRKGSGVSCVIATSSS